jgi:tRNA (guanine37-N1)-methyltransferase
MSWTVRLLTLFPEMFPGPLGQSLAGKALNQGLWGMEVLDIRGFARDKHRSVDDTPFGGGAGMVLRPDVIDTAIRSIPENGGTVGRLVYLTPRGRLLTQQLVKEIAAEPVVTVLCGRYEGVDERVLRAHDADEVSVGDYVLSGGEPAAMILIDACVRLLPGVMGNAATPDEESFEGDLLEYPHYTRPALWRDGGGNEWPVPDVLVSGHHERVKAWRRAEAEATTRTRRPDLWTRHSDRNQERGSKP